ncbi:MAG: peptidylprolyl isomerase, partial [Mogibacterium sp.]|nr:peptidylprolyl isomerase [Mogibacterium sp.]
LRKEFPLFDYITCVDCFKYMFSLKQLLFKIIGLKRPNSAGSQFFIMTSTSPHLDGDYAAFGRVTEGMETADKIVNSKRNMMDKPLEDQRIKSIRVEA